MYWDGRKVLVAGGAGFVGSYVVENLVRRGARVTVADNFSRGRLENLSSVVNQVQIVKCNLINWFACQTVCRDIDVVFNAAAKVTGIEYNRHHHADMFYNNMLLQMNVPRMAMESGVRKFVQVSTACIYGHDVNVPTGEWEAEVIDPEPTNYGYGLAKHAGEKFALFCAEESSMEVVVARFFNAVGVRDYYDEETSHVVPALIRRVLSGESPLVVWGTGTQSRSFVDARDLAEGLVLLAEKALNKSVVNIGHDREITIRDLAQLVCRVCGKSDLPTVFDTTKPNGYERRAANITALKSITNGWYPQIPLEETVSLMVEEYKQKYLKERGNGR
jgi:nucleoside-diphosphate-sugar epimerase